jgi:hypothetical protein
VTGEPLNKIADLFGLNRRQVETRSVFVSDFIYKSDFQILKNSPLASVSV